MLTKRAFWWLPCLKFGRRRRRRREGVTSSPVRPCIVKRSVEPAWLMSTIVSYSMLVAYDSKHTRRRYERFPPRDYRV